MKFLTVRHFRIRLGTVWKSLEEEEEVVITSKGKPIALLTGVSDVTFGETVKLLRRAKAELAVSRMRKDAARRGISGLVKQAIENEISSVRKARK